MKGKVLSKVLAVTLAFVMVFTGVGIGQWGLEDASAATSGVVNVDFSAVVGTEDKGLDPNTGYYFAYMPKEINVSAGLAYQYGLGDKPTTQPTVLDAVVAAHVDKYGKAFTKDTAQEYLNAGLGDDAGEAAAFGVSNKYFGHVINGLYSDDYASKAILLDGDRVELFTYESNWELGADYYTTFGTRSITAQDSATLTLKGGCYNTLFSDLMLSKLPEKSVGYIDENGVIQLCSMTDENAILNFTKEECKSLVDTGVITLVAYDATGNDKYFPSAATITFVNELSEQNRLDNIADRLSWMKISGTNTQNAKVINNLNLPSEFEGANVTWESSNPDVVSASGVVNRPELYDGDKEVSLRATLSLNGVTAEKSFNVIVKKKTAPILSEDDRNAKIDRIIENLSDLSDRETKTYKQQLLSSPDWIVALYANGRTLSEEEKEPFLAKVLSDAQMNINPSSLGSIAKDVCALVAMGLDPRKLTIEGKTINLLEKIYNADEAALSIYNAPYVLLAYKCHDSFSVPEDAKLTETKVAEYILKNQTEDGAIGDAKWKSAGNTASIMLGLAFKKDEETVGASLEKAEAYIKSEINTDCYFGGPNDNAFVVLAEAMIGKNPELIQYEYYDYKTNGMVGGADVLDALLTDTNEDCFTYQGSYNSYATADGYRALVSYKKIKDNGSGNIYYFADKKLDAVTE